MAAPSTHAHTLNRNPAAAITSGSVMNGPTPIISSILNSTAERRPMRRSSPASLPVEFEFIGLTSLFVLRGL